MSPALTILSLILALVGWHGALDLARRAGARSGWRRATWHLAAAATACLAVWSIPLLALVPGPTAAPIAWTSEAIFLSLAVGVVSLAVGFAIAERAGRVLCIVAAFIVGSGLCSIYFIEIGGIRGRVAAGFEIGPVAVSAFLATVSGAIALLLHRETQRPVGRLLGTLLLGMSTIAMLSASLLATEFDPSRIGDQVTAFPAAPLAVGAGLCTVVMFAIGLLVSLFDRRIEVLALRSTRLVRQKEERLQRILEQLPFGVLVADAATGAVTFSNNEANRVLREVEPDGAASTASRLSGIVGRPLARALRDEETIQRELHTGRRRDGSTATLEVSAAPIYDEHRRAALAIAAFQDVSVRVKAEIDLRQAQKMDALGQLTGGIAHDINNLLTAILGNLDLLEPRLVDEGQRTFLRNALSATERGARLTSQLLGFSRRQSLEPSPVDINRAVADMRPLLASTLGGTIRIDCALDPDLWPACADPTQLELVLLNLSINARDAMPAGGIIRIRTANVVLAERTGPADPAPGDYATVSVCDSGAGMGPATLSRAFEPFFTTKAPGKGSGLGLSQVLGIAQQLGGGVRIASEPGRGTQVQLFMPRSRAEVQAAPAASAENLAERRDVLLGKTILLVDDDRDVRVAARALLGQLGCIVIEEDDGRAAVARVAGPERIDIVLIDFAMPIMTGADAGERMRAIRPNLPILLITGYADADHLPGVGGRFPTLQKPFRGADLAELLPGLLPANARPERPAAPSSVVPLTRRRPDRDIEPNALQREIC